MRSLGKTYLVEIPNNNEEVLEGGIILPKQRNQLLVHYKGVIKEIGLGFNNDNIVNIGDKIIFNWKQKKGKVKIILGQKLFYIIEEELILAIQE